MSHRATQLNQWLEQIGYRNYRLSPASEDASFRSYLRLETDAESLIIMDAPPDRESCDQFIAVAEKLRHAGVNAPAVLAQNLNDGFLVLTDFGGSDYLSQLNAENEASLYGDALDALLLMQTRIDAADLPLYDAALLNQEMDLFHDWFLEKLLGISLDREQQSIWLSIKQALIENSLAQPQVFVHRDYHSRNLMRLDNFNPGILDFQDAVKGPLTYDLVSLLRDCYVDWPAERVLQLVLDYHQSARNNGLTDADPEQFMRWFNLTGIQRHLKAIGIFSRLKLRDGKSGYLKDIPRTLEYLRQVSAAEMSMTGLSAMIEKLGLKSRIATVLSP